MRSTVRQSSASIFLYILRCFLIRSTNLVSVFLTVYILGLTLLYLYLVFLVYDLSSSIFFGILLSLWVLGSFFVIISGLMYRLASRSQESFIEHLHLSQAFLRYFPGSDPYINTLVTMLLNSFIFVFCVIWPHIPYHVICLLACSYSSCYTIFSK